MARAKAEKSGRIGRSAGDNQSCDSKYCLYLVCMGANPISVIPSSSERLH